jgi:hypothetical protein
LRKWLAVTSIVILTALTVFFLADAVRHVSNSYRLLREHRGGLLDFLETSYLSALELLVGVAELLVFVVLLYLDVEVVEKILLEDCL